MPNTEKLSHARLVRANHDPRQAARAAHLVYTNDSTPGIKRIKKGKGFVYLLGNKIIRNKKQLERIRKLAIPPSWSNVWICRSPNGHIQATGLDLRNRKQYRYHPGWNKLRNETKFHHLLEFGKLLPRLRKRIRRDLAAKKLTREKVLATAIDLMEKTYIRVGSESYEKQNGSYGLTTLKDQHISFQQDQVFVSFNGKKGVEHNISLKDRKLARIIKQCRDIPGKSLFQYYDETNQRQSIDSAMLNNYIKEATAPEFSAKDIRTWAGSVQAIHFYLTNPDSTAAGMLDFVSEKLGNTKNVCKKYYVHPSLLTLCEEKKELPGYKKIHTGFSESEQLLMGILRQA